MYPSSMNNNSYPLYYNQSTTLPAENNHIPYQNHQELYSYLVPSNVPAILENPINTLFLGTPINKENTLNNSPSFNMNNQLVASKRVSGKRDRHTKISTAQGVRDRRVRLSISIAREFFNLQDMLGFDKASKTLGWLLEKSKAAIEELTSSAKEEDYVITTLDNNVVAHSPEMRDKDKDEDNYEDQDNDDEKKDLEAKSTSKRKGPSKHHCCSDQNAAKETRKILRVKARERARERTKTKKPVINNPSQQHHHHQPESSSTHQNEQNLVFLESISPAATVPSTSSSYGMMNKGVSVAESVVIRSKSPRRLPSYNYNYDNIMSKDDQGSYYNDYYNDYIAKLQLEGANNSGIIQQQPGLSALNIINLSTEIHINAKTWDNDFSNRNLH